MRLGRFKVIYFYQPRRWEVYDLEDDLGETRDLANSQPDRRRRLAARMIRELRGAGVQWPTNRESGEPELPRL